ncbi:MAG: DMP19 family protein [Gemmatimonadota bacterium]|nr:DMP19 family protein [Gemmatimonadota bacterium]
MEYGPNEMALDLDALRAGGAEFEVRLRLEQLLLQTLRKDGLRGVAQLLASVPGYGVRQLQGGESENAARYSCLGGDGPAVIVYASTTPDLDVIDVTADDGPHHPVESDPWHDRFYGEWEAMLGLDDAAVAKLDLPRRAVFLIGLLEAEVMNGGLGQYLTNTDGVHLESTLGLLDEIGATRTRRILARAVGLSSDAESFVAAWDGRSEEFSALDDEFLAAAEDLAGMTARAFLA